MPQDFTSRLHRYQSYFTQQCINKRLRANVSFEQSWEMSDRFREHPTNIGDDQRISDWRRKKPASRLHEIRTRLKHSPFFILTAMSTGQ